MQSLPIFFFCAVRVDEGAQPANSVTFQKSLPICLQLLFHRWGTDTLAHFQWEIKWVDCTNVIQDCSTQSFLSHISHRTQTSAEGKGWLNRLPPPDSSKEINNHKHSQLPQGLQPCRADRASTLAETSFWIPWPRLELQWYKSCPTSPASLLSWLAHSWALAMPITHLLNFGVLGSEGMMFSVWGHQFSLSHCLCTGWYRSRANLCWIGLVTPSPAQSLLQQVCCATGCIPAYAEGHARDTPGFLQTAKIFALITALPSKYISALLWQIFLMASINNHGEFLVPCLITLELTAERSHQLKSPKRNLLRNSQNKIHLRRQTFAWSNGVQSLHAHAAGILVS